MGALLALIPIKDWIYGSIIVGLLAGFGIWIHKHDTKIVDEALAPVAVLAQKAQIQVAVGTAVAQSTETANAKSYDETVAAPAPADLGLVCHSEAASSGIVSQTGTGTEAAVGEQTADSGNGSAFDPSGAILQRAAEADAQIMYLQGRVTELENQMKASP